MLNNAVKFTEDGEHLPDRHGLARRSDGDIELHLTVRDTGIGISADGLERLFQSFSQADVSISRRYGGTGLGLAISKRLAEAMGGTMWAESDGVAGQGSTFHVTLVTRATADAAARSRTRRPGFVRARPRAEHPGIRLRILLAEDNAVNQKLALRLLSLMGYQADVAGNGIEALEAVERQPYDVVLHGRADAGDGRAGGDAPDPSRTARLDRGSWP